LNKFPLQILLVIVPLALFLTCCSSQPQPQPQPQLQPSKSMTSHEYLFPVEAPVDTQWSRRSSVVPSIKPAIQATRKKTAYLTFDDGPSANTVRILDILQRYSIHATFFVIGDSSSDAQRLYRLIHEKGHVIGNHTYSHDYALLYSSEKSFTQDTERLSKLLEQTTGVKPTLFRFPGGSNNQVSRHYASKGIMPKLTSAISREGYAYTDWNVSSTDAAQLVQPKNDIVSAVLSASKTKQEAIILMHDVSSKKTTVEALPEVIEGLIQQGFRFSVLSKDTFRFQFLKP
jgi:peptidoglycan/xylan/chitin deacetylase (PgdA/CDA1 family)